MSEQTTNSPPTNSPHRASAPSPSERGSRLSSQAPEVSKTPEHKIVDPRFGDGMAILKDTYMKDEMDDGLTDATEASRVFGYIMDTVAKKINAPKQRLMLIAGDKLDALMEVALELKEENRALKAKVKELEEEKTQSGGEIGSSSS